jgi:hypothetical protein
MRWSGSTGLDRFNRANICASTAIGTDVSINFIDFAFGDGVNRTFVDTGSASGTLIGDFVCHNF